MKSSKKLFNKNYFLLWQGQFVSKIGSQLFFIAVMLWIKEITGSASFMGLIGAISGFIVILLGPIAGTFADRHSRKLIIVVTDLLNGIAVLILSVIAMIVKEDTNLILLTIFIVSVINAIFSSFFRPAISASIPELVPKSKLTGANSLSQFSTQISGLLGLGVGGILFTILGAPILFLINGISYIFSAISESFMHIPQELPEKKDEWNEKFAEFKKDIVEGFKYIWKKDGLRELVFISAFLNFFTQPIILLLPFFVEDYLKVGNEWYGFLMSIYGLGTLIGYTSAGILRLKGRVRSIVLILFMILQPGAYGVLAIITKPQLALLLAAIPGAMNGFIMVNIATLLQITTPSKIRGRVFGLLTTLVGSLAPLGMGLAGIVADLANHNIPLIYLSSSGIMVFLSSVTTMRKSVRQFLAFEYSQPKVNETSIKQVVET